jgi:hypothetical protein
LLTYDESAVSVDVVDDLPGGSVSLQEGVLALGVLQAAGLVVAGVDSGVIVVDPPAKVVVGRVSVDNGKEGDSHNDELGVDDIGENETVIALSDFYFHGNFPSKLEIF